METKDFNFMKKHWINTIETWGKKEKNLAHRLLFGDGYSPIISYKIGKSGSFNIKDLSIIIFHLMWPMYLNVHRLPEQEV